MYNHARTILLNSQPQRPDIPGEELIPATFVPFRLPEYLQTVRYALFGLSPDRFMLNYRLRQLLALIATTPLQEYLEELDPRTTYDLRTTGPVFGDLFTPQVSKRPNRVIEDFDQEIFDALELRVSGAPAEPDFSGITAYSFFMQFTGTNLSPAYTITRTTTPRDVSVFTPSFDSGWSTPMSLAYTGYSVQISQLRPDADWLVQGYLQPAFSLIRLANSLKKLSPSLHDKVFGLPLVEPYTTFRKCWEQHPEFACRLAGFLLAFIYRSTAVGRDIGYVAEIAAVDPYVPSLDFSVPENSQYYVLGWP
jgi:hypothetical protein